MFYTNNVFFIKINCKMGLLSKGFYTRGNKTTSQISLLTGMVAGDTVFNTDREERLVYDGNRWVSGNQITLVTRGITPGGSPQLTGSSSTIADQDFTIRSGVSATNDENIIGNIQGVPGDSFTVGTNVVLQYRGPGQVSNLNAVTTGQYIDLSSTPGRATGATSPGIGTFGVFLESAAGTGVIFGMIQPIEVN
jgi:hypothetical protein